jgi:hypothetical protein
MLRQRYILASLSALVLAACANEQLLQDFLQQQQGHPYMIASVIALASGVMASSMGFQFFQIPNIVANTSFREHKAVCISFSDGVGFFMAAPLWAAIGRIVSIPSLGWSAAWAILAAIYAMGGVLMLKALPPVLMKEAKA